MTVTLHPSTVHRFASGQLDAAQRATASALSLRGDLAPLVPTFGLIGAEFLAALAKVLDLSARHLDNLGAHHGSTAVLTRAGLASYEGADAAAAARTRAS
ncbi:hypothetical protein GOARA_016_00060 [Gordonia araii NBRC 100433]|uniref:ESX-1 secretion-associated protein n=1 Tax=Gordonia araii NBRC 100433 TaxID=1073574 RepID=G7GYM7_9ACTN|nr:type VII secretion target [Gordonia araii]NNG99236.1 hypothetical protein [Gordonia araii NBRC 100433]GAB08702.1 hypothetical protein GOARA_016_00060 [Gordonia araii NBRC 100433]